MAQTLKEITQGMLGEMAYMHAENLTQIGALREELIGARTLIAGQQQEIERLQRDRDLWHARFTELDEARARANWTPVTAEADANGR